VLIKINQSINQWRWQTQAHLSLHVRIVLKTLVLISNNLCIRLRSISGTSKVSSVINFHILELPKVIKSRLKCINRVNINYSIRQNAPNITYSISERELSKIIVTSVFQIKVISFSIRVAYCMQESNQINQVQSKSTGNWKFTTTIIQLFCISTKNSHQSCNLTTMTNFKLKCHLPLCNFLEIGNCHCETLA